MASWIIHLRVAENVFEMLPPNKVKYEDFVFGNIAPDSGKPNENETSYHPPKTVTHFQPPKGYPDIDNFRNTYLKNVSVSDDGFSFLLGYYSHLITDRCWMKYIFDPSTERFRDEYEAEERYVFIRKLKRDWYDLDKLFLLNTPSFKPYEIIGSKYSFNIQVLPFLSADIFEDLIRRIKEFYSNPYDRDPEDEFKYLTYGEMNDFIHRASDDIMNKLSEFI